MWILGAIEKLLAAQDPPIRDKFKGIDRVDDESDSEGGAFVNDSDIANDAD